MIPYLLILLAFLADRLSKSWAAGYFAEHGPTRFNQFFTLSETYNQGIAFGMFQGTGRWVGWLTIIVVIGMFIYMIRLPKSMWLVRFGLSLVIGGALGNLVDRVTVGKVLDFIVTPIRPGIFNVADVMIHLGLIMAIIGSFWRSQAFSEKPGFFASEKPGPLGSDSSPAEPFDATISQAGID